MITAFLDFDGVLFDTAKEAYLLARYAFYGVSPFEEINNAEYQKFYQNKYLVTNSWQYYYLMKSLEFEKIEKKFNQFIKNRINDDLIFDKKFQTCRKDLMQNHFDFWNSLDKPYPFFDEFKKLQNSLNIIIVSTKNQKAIYERLKQLDFNLPLEKIIGKEILEHYKSKGEFLNEYITKNNIQSAIFVDDSQENLYSCKNIKGLELFLASWGYSNPKYIGKNCDEIIKIIKEKV